MIKKTSSIVIEKSVLPSCSIGQSPLSSNSGHFVVTNATPIITSKGTAASLVKSPITISIPQTISNAPVNGAQNPAGWIPNFSNRPLPKVSGYMNFCTPSDKKTSPTVSRINRPGYSPACKSFLILVDYQRYRESIFSLLHDMHSKVGAIPRHDHGLFENSLVLSLHSPKRLRRVTGMSFKIFDKMRRVFKRQSKRNLSDGIIRIGQQPPGFIDDGLSQHPSSRSIYRFAANRVQVLRGRIQQRCIMSHIILYRLITG